MKNQDINEAAKKHGVPISWVHEALVDPKVRSKGLSFACYYAVAMQNNPTYDTDVCMKQAARYLEDYLRSSPVTHTTESYDRLVWIDYRVFWANMPFIAVHSEDHRIIQSASEAHPKEMWADCLELTFDGANMGDHYAVYDYMFDNHMNHPAVLKSISCANDALEDIGAY